MSRIKMNQIFKSIALLACLMLAGKAWGQQEPQYTQYMFNTMSVNPAYAGTREALNVLMLSRLQWTGLEGAPKSYTFAAHAPINNKKIGVGASLIADNIGPVTNTYFNLNYSHRIKINQNMTLAMGLKGGIYNYAVDLNSLNIIEGDDAAFSSDYKKKWQPNLGVGFYLYHQKFYAGFSVPKLVQTTLEDGSGTDEVADLKRHYFIIAGYVFDLSSEWKLKPSVLNKMVSGAPPSTDITVQALYRNKYWMGTTYRIGDALAFMANIQVNRQLMLGYSYDITTSELNQYNNGTHEFIISYDFSGFSNDKVKSPRYF